MKKLKYILGFLLVACVAYAALPITYKQAVISTVSFEAPTVKTATLTSTSTDQDLTLDPNGTGKILLPAQTELRFQDAAGGQYTGLKADTTISSSLTFTLPIADGTNGQVLKTNGSGVLSFGSDNTGSSLLSARTVSSYPDTATTDDDVLCLTTASGTVNLYTASGNTGETIELIHCGTSQTHIFTIDPNGSETLDGSSSNYILAMNGDYIKAVALGGNWVTLAKSKRTAQSIWANPSARGSVDTFILNYVTITTTDPYGFFTITDNASNATSITFNKKGVVQVSGHRTGGASTETYISLNQATLTTAPTGAELLHYAANNINSSGNKHILTANEYVNAGDVMRIPADGNGASDDRVSFFFEEKNW